MNPFKHSFPTLRHLTCIRIFIALALAFSAPELVLARITESWTYEEMFNKANVVVIARRVSTKDSGEHTMLLDIEPPVHVLGVVTDFKSLLILKGPRDLSTFQLHHYRFQSESDKKVANGPELVRFSFEHPAFLLFLIKERDGRYAPVGGQTDPAGLSVLELGGAAN